MKTQRKKIKAWLAFNDRSVSQLAQAAGCATQSLYDYLAGRTPWRADVALVVSLITGIELATLLDPDGKCASAAADFCKDLDNDWTRS